MKIGDGHWARYLSRAALVVTLIGSGLLITGVVNADDTAAVAEDSNSPEQIGPLVQAGVRQSTGTVAVTTAGMAVAAAAGEDFDEDPWEGFNEKMFWFNREVLDSSRASRSTAPSGSSDSSTLLKMPLASSKRTKTPVRLSACGAWGRGLIWYCRFSHR